MHNSEMMDYKNILYALAKVGGLNQTGLAERLRVTQPTISRWKSGVQRPDKEQHDSICALAIEMGILTELPPYMAAAAERGLEKIAYRYMPDDIMRSTLHRARGLSENDIQQVYQAPAFHQAAPDNPNQSTWLVKNRALELAGYLPGDYLLIDQSITPRHEDIVCANVAKIDEAGAETKFRLYRPPFLLTRTLDKNSDDMPLYVDGERVVIMGVVIKSVRIRPD
jgi:transcriptional regulator with XRE-family HTH domain